MKAVILAGGRGSRISEESDFKPKPMSEIGNMPILWHIMKIYSYHGVNEFVILAGYKSCHIKFFYNYNLRLNSVEFNLSSENKNNWKKLIGKLKLSSDKTMTGGRILRAKKYIGEMTSILHMAIV